MNAAGEGRSLIEPYADVAIVGSGISSSFLVLKLLDRLLETPRTTPTQLLVLERDEHFYTGIPYGPRSGATSLIITPLDEFLPPEDLDSFVEWLQDNASWALDDAKRHNGALTAEWLERAASAIAAGEVRRMHVPRYLFGLYLSSLVVDRAARARDEGAAELTLRHADVARIEQVIAVDDSQSLRYELTAGDVRHVARRVVVAVGIPPTRRLFGSCCPGALLVEDPYVFGLDRTLAGIASHLDRGERDRSSGGGSEGPVGITIVGANASSLEILYQLSNTPRVADHRPKITVLSPQGRLPPRYTAVPDPMFVPGHLRRLAADGNGARVTAASILAAAKLDIAAAQAAEVSISDSLPPTSAAVSRLLPLLDADELQRFAAGPGIEIGRLQRRAGDEYCDAADELARAGRLEVVAGSFDHVAAANRRTVRVVYTTDDASTAMLPEPQAVVINCSGSAGLARPNQSPLIESLLATGMCQASASGTGLAVDDRFQAHEGLYVHGPLLAGNVVEGGAIWHVEHCGRIINLSGRLADRILADLGAERPNGDRSTARLDRQGRGR